MKSCKLLTIAIAFIFIAGSQVNAQDLTEITIKVILKSSDGKALKGAKIVNERTKKPLKSGDNGEVDIVVRKQDQIDITFGKKSINYTIDDNDLTNKQIAPDISTLLEDDAPEEHTARYAGTSKSYWLGSTLGYNFGGKSTEDIVGSAKVIINPLTKKILNAEWGVIGNFSNFQSTQNKENIEANLKKITQSEQGLLMGIS